MLQCSSNILVKITAIKHFFIIILRHLAKIYPVQTFGISISKLKVLLRDQLILLLSKDALSLHQNWHVIDQKWQSTDRLLDVDS